MRFSAAFHLELVDIEFATFSAIKTLPKLYSGLKLKLVVMV